MGHDHDPGDGRGEEVSVGCQARELTRCGTVSSERSASNWLHADRFSFYTFHLPPEPLAWSPFLTPAVFLVVIIFIIRYTSMVTLFMIYIQILYSECVGPWKP